VDEVDSVLVDDARTPLIISGPTPEGDRHEFNQLKPQVSDLVLKQKSLLNNVLAEAKNKIKEGNKEEGGKLLYRVFRGLPKNKALIKFLSEEGIKQRCWSSVKSRIHEKRPSTIRMSESETWKWNWLVSRRLCKARTKRSIRPSLSYSMSSQLPTRMRMQATSWNRW
jgi:preprotein translocase subunit SecA